MSELSNFCVEEIEVFVLLSLIFGNYLVRNKTTAFNDIVALCFYNYPPPSPPIIIPSFPPLIIHKKSVQNDKRTRRYK